LRNVDALRDRDHALVEPWRAARGPGHAGCTHLRSAMHTPTLSLVFLATAAVSVAAAPAREEASARVRYGDARAQPPVGAQPADGWIELASATPASHGREFIAVDASTGELTELRLTATSGRPYIGSVRVDFQDNSRRVFQVDKVLGPRRRSISLDLHGARAIEQIIVTTDRSSPGAYVVEASTAGDSVASR
jgi:hypothetical protein